jgi:predicted GTPase
LILVQGIQGQIKEILVFLMCKASHNLNSVTAVVQQLQVSYEDSKGDHHMLHLLDMPGFGDTNKS